MSMTGLNLNERRKAFRKASISTTLRFSRSNLSECYEEVSAILLRPSELSEFAVFGRKKVN